MESNTLLTALETLGMEQPTLKAIATVLEIAPVRLYAVGKQPKEGEVYSAKTYNWDAIDRFITRRLSEDKGYGTMEEFLKLVEEVDKELASQDGRKGRRASTGANKISVGDKEMPARKYNVQVGDKVMLKKELHTVPYTVMLTSDTHIVLQLDGTPELRALSNWTTNLNLIVNGCDIEAAIEDRIAAAAEAEVTSDRTDSE